MLSKFRNVNPISHVAKDGSGNIVALFTEIDTPFDPQGEGSDDFIRLARDAINAANDEATVTFDLAFGQTVMFDVVKEARVRRVCLVEWSMRTQAAC